MYDLNIRLKSSKEKDSKLAIKRLFELGWDCVAWTTLANGKVSGNQIKPIKGVILEPIQRRDGLELRSLVTGRTAVTDIRQISRITVTIDDVIDAQTLTSGNAILNSFDIVAVRPGNMKVMAYLCKTAEIDIITLDFTHRLPFATNKKLLDEAVKRGIYFEIIYSPIVGAAPGPRQEVFSNTRVLIQYLRGRNILLSSGADSIGQLRGPMDVCNIGKALGLNNEQAANAVSNNCAMVLKHAAARKCRFLPLEVVSRADFKLRYPEINLNDSQSHVGSADSGLTYNEDSFLKFGLSNDEEVNDDDDDDGDEIVDAEKTCHTSSDSADADLDGGAENVRAEVYSTSQMPPQDTVFEVGTESVREQVEDIEQNVGYEEMRQEETIEEHNSFSLGDAFISFSDSPPSSLSKKRTYTEEGERSQDRIKVVKSTEDNVKVLTVISLSKLVRVKKGNKIKASKNSSKLLTKRK